MSGLGSVCLVEQAATCVRVRLSSRRLSVVRVSAREGTVRVREDAKGLASRESIRRNILEENVFNGIFDIARY